MRIKYNVNMTLESELTKEQLDKSFKSLLNKSGSEDIFFTPTTDTVFKVKDFNIEKENNLNIDEMLSKFPDSIEYKKGSFAHLKIVPSFLNGRSYYVEYRNFRNNWSIYTTHGEDSLRKACLKMYNILMDNNIIANKREWE